jgi:hypothetical protein
MRRSRASEKAAGRWRKEEIGENSAYMGLGSSASEMVVGGEMMD